MKWIWSSKCQLKYPTIKYVENYLSFYVEKELHPISPIIISGEDIIECDITPSFYLFDKNTCEFKGNPIEFLERTLYSIKVLNSRGWSEEYIMSIAIYNGYPLTYSYPNNMNFYVNVYNTYSPIFTGSEFPGYYTTSDTLPNGLTLNYYSGIISGTSEIKETKDFSFNIYAGDGIITVTYQPVIHLICIFIYIFRY